MRCPNAKPSKSMCSSSAAGRPGCPRRFAWRSCRKAAGGEPLAIAVLEKAREAGAHMLSGAVLDPSALKLLVPDFKERERAARVGSAPRSRALPHARREGHVSDHAAAARQPRQLHHLAEPLREVAGRPGRGRRRRRVHRLSRRSRCCTRTTAWSACGPGDRGIGKHGERKSSFEPGVDIRAKVTILADGVRGNLTKAVVRRLALDAGRQPQLYALGIKELWDVPADRVPPGTVIAHDGLSAADGGVRRRLHLQHARGAAGGRVRLRARLPGSDVRSARPVPALQAASVRRRACSRAARWCATAPRRCPKADGTRSRASTPTAC